MLNNIFILLPLIISLIIAGIVYGAIFFTIQRYKQTTYYKDTKIPYTAMRKDLGRYGEYLTYMYLRNYENNGAKFLFNVYLPRENGETTEIDVLMIQQSGLYVFESKNYSGWIFGSENDKNWTQTLPRGRKARKEKFFNPVMQNKLHIKWLKNIVGEELPVHSVVVFSERCALKSINVKDESVKIIKRNEVSATVDQINQTAVQTLSDDTIKEIYGKLYPYTRMTDEQKHRHISNIESHINAVSQKKTLPDTKSESPLCPRCGSPLVLRTSKKGDLKGRQFYGCSAFPKCRYRLDINIFESTTVKPDTTNPADDTIKETNNISDTKLQVPSEQAQQNEHSVESPDKAVSPGKTLPICETAASTKPEGSLCPRCGSPLVLRTTKKGDKKGQNFYGCSSFPKCRYTLDIDTPETQN